MSRCIDYIPEYLRDRFSNLVKFAVLYQEVMGKCDHFWKYYIEYVLECNRGRAIALDKPIYSLLKPYDRNPVSSSDKYKFAMWVNLYRTLYTDYRLNIRDETGLKLFTYIGRYAFWILFKKMNTQHILSKEDIVDAIDQSLFINIFTGWVCLSTSTTGISRDMWVKVIKNICWDFARGRVEDRNLSIFLEHSPYFWIHKGDYKQWSSRTIQEKISALSKLYSGDITDPNSFCSAQETLDRLLQYHPDTDGICVALGKAESEMELFLKKANPTYIR